MSSGNYDLKNLQKTEQLEQVFSRYKTHLKLKLCNFFEN